MQPRHAAPLIFIAALLLPLAQPASAEAPASEEPAAPDVAEIAALDAALSAVGRDLPESRARDRLLALLSKPLMNRVRAAASRSGAGELVEQRKDELRAHLEKTVKAWVEELRSKPVSKVERPWRVAMRAATSDRAAEDLLAAWLGFPSVGQLPAESGALFSSGAAEGSPTPVRLADQASARAGERPIFVSLQDSSLVAEAGGAGHGNGALDEGEWALLELVLVNSSDAAVPAREARLSAVGRCLYVDGDIERPLAEMGPAGGRSNLRVWVYLGVCEGRPERALRVELDGGDDDEEEEVTVVLMPVQRLSHAPLPSEIRLAASGGRASESGVAPVLVAADTRGDAALSRAAASKDSPAPAALSALVASRLRFSLRPAPEGEAEGNGRGDRLEIAFDGAGFAEEHARLVHGEGVVAALGGFTPVASYVQRRYVALSPSAPAPELSAAPREAVPAAASHAPPTPAQPSPPTAESADDREGSPLPSLEDAGPPMWRVDLAISTGSLDTVEPGGDRPLWSRSSIPLKSVDLRVSYGPAVAGTLAISYAPGSDSTDDGNVSVSDMKAAAGASYVWRPLSLLEVQPRALLALVRRSVDLPGEGSDAVGVKVASDLGLTLRLLPVPNGGLVADLSATFGGASPVVDGEAVLGGTFLRFGGGLSLVF
jgi:hypothetical protein